MSWKLSHSRWEISIKTEYEKQLEREKADTLLRESRMDMMLMQIQPHFIYNTLEGIGELCHSNPEYAEKVVTEFACFLRGNLSVLSEQKIIPFQQELEHVKHYLFCEKMRFDERLNVIYSIQATDFSLPTLSLQPIVENAVHYGVARREEGGTIRIESMELEDAYVIRVSDNGDGFSHLDQKNQEHQHIGIQNVRLRLQQQCNGKLDIERWNEMETVVTLTIPKTLSEEG